jgi:hypothetical protein
VKAAVVVYCLVIALMMTAWWGLDIRHGALRRPDRRSAEIAPHLAAELVTACRSRSGPRALLNEIPAMRATVISDLALLAGVVLAGALLAATIAERTPKAAG